MRTLFSTLLLCLAFMSMQAASIPEQIMAKHKNGESFMLEFTEVKSMPKLKKETTQEGMLMYKWPEYLRMDYTQPDGDYTLITAGKFEVCKGGKVQQMPISNEKSKMAVFKNMLLLAMHGRVAEIAKPQEAQVAYEETDSEWVCVLTDEKAKGAQDIKRLTITYNRQSGRITGMTVEYPNGNTTTWTMKK